MFNKSSLTWTSMLAFAVIWFLQWAELDVDEGQVTEFVFVGLQIVTGFTALLGRFRQGDIDIFGMKLNKGEEVEVE